jgi:hypothetical protein
MYIPKTPKRQQQVATTLQNRIAAGNAGPNAQNRLNAIQSNQVPPRATGGPSRMAPSIPRAQSGFKLGTTLEELQSQRANTKGTNRISMIDNAIANLTPVSTTPVGTPQVELPDSMPMEPRQTESTFKSSYDFLPQNLEDDPIYQDGLAKGSQKLKRLLAARGLSDSALR